MLGGYGFGRFLGWNNILNVLYLTFVLRVFGWWGWVAFSALSEATWYAEVRGWWGKELCFFFLVGFFVLPLVVSKILYFQSYLGKWCKFDEYYWNGLKPTTSCGLWCHGWSNVFLVYGDRVERSFEKADQSTRKNRIDNTNKNLLSTVNGTISASQHIFSSVFLRLFEGWGK